MMHLSVIWQDSNNEKEKSQDQKRGFKNDGSVSVNNAPHQSWDKTFDYRITLEVDPSE
jgi:hypothetical protein